MVRTRTGDWVVRVTHPNGNIAEPEVVGTPTRKPKVNGLPAIRIPIEKDSKWDDPVWEEQPMEVYYKGSRQNIEQFERVEQTESGTQIIGRGGVELRNIVDTEYQEEESTTVADDVITNNTSYTANVDPITASTDENVQIDSATTTTDFQNNTTDLPVTDPFVATGNNMELAQASFGSEAEDAGFGTYETQDDVSYSNSQAQGLGGQFGSIGDGFTFNFTPQYDIPAGNVEMAVRWLPDDLDSDGNTNDITGLKWEINGEAVFQTGSTFALVSSSLNWRTETGVSSDLTAGNNVNVNIELTANGQSDHDGIIVDYIAVYDNRFSWTLDNNTNANGYLDGPELYPDVATMEFDAVTTADSVTGGRVESTWDDTTGVQAIGLSNDGTNFTTANNSTTLETDFTNAGTELTFQITAGRYGTTTGSTPLTGVNGQKVNDYTLFADLTPIPFVINTTFNDRVTDVLNAVADTGDFVWEFQIDDAGNKSVQFTTNEQREVQSDVPINDFSVSKDISTRIEKVILFGGAQSGSDVIPSATLDSANSLDAVFLKEGSETVSSNDSDSTYTRGIDYTISYRNGDVTPLSSGNISAGESLTVNFGEKIRAVDETGVANPRTEVITIPEITTQELADRIVSTVLSEVSVLEKTVDVTIPSNVERFSPIDAIAFDDIAPGENYQIKVVEGTPNAITVRAGNREGLQDVTDEIRSQLKTVSRKS